MDTCQAMTLSPRALRAAKRLESLIRKAQSLQSRMDICRNAADDAVVKLSEADVAAINALHIVPTINVYGKPCVSGESWGDFLA